MGYENVKKLNFLQQCPIATFRENSDEIFSS
jgi:hypothetical protein